ncbi:MAG: hypothetical protein V3R93_05480 [Candidatus Hydrothermarchaeaceae archaeon]
MKEVYRSLTDLVGDIGIKDKIREISTLNKDFAELRRVLDESQSAEEAKQGFSRLKKRFRRKARRGEKSRNYRRMVRQMTCWERGLFHCYADERIPRTNNDMEFVVKRLRRSWKRTTGLVNIDEYLLYHAPYAIYLLNFRLGYLAELGIQVNPYDAVKEVPRDKYRAAMKEAKKRKELDVFRKRANKDIAAALERIVEMNSGLGGS